MGSSGGYLSAELSSGVSFDKEAEDSREEFATTSSGDNLTIAVAILATGGIVAAGLTWAVQQRLIATPLPGIIPNPPALPAPASAPAARSYKNCTAGWNAIGRFIKRGVSLCFCQGIGRVLLEEFWGEPLILMTGMVDRLVGRCMADQLLVSGLTTRRFWRASPKKNSPRVNIA